MIRWARLTWQARDPAALAADLGARLGRRAARLRGPGPAYVLRLGDSDLEIRPWLPETAADEPSAGGRLVFEPLAGGASARPAGSRRPSLALAGVGWATVDLDRAAEELGPWLGPAAPGTAPGWEAADPHLGARVRVRPAAGLPGEAIVLAEPATEGRLAATLARDGEGPAALYLEPAGGLRAWLAAARARGVATSAVRDGPLGPSVLLLGGPVAGPHVLLVDHARTASAPRPPDTIRR